jgi:hypothetical protein
LTISRLPRTRWSASWMNWGGIVSSASFDMGLAYR